MDDYKTYIKRFLEEFKLESCCSDTVTNNRDFLAATYPLDNEVLKDAYGVEHSVPEEGILILGKYAMMCLYCPTINSSFLSLDDFGKLNELEDGILTVRDQSLHANIDSIASMEEEDIIYVHPEDFAEPDNLGELGESYDGGEAFRSYVPAPEPGLYGDYEPAKRSESSGKIMLDLPDSRMIMDLLCEMALEHGQFLENSTPDATGRIPVYFEGGSGPVLMKFPKFGTDVRIHMPDEDNLKDLKSRDRYVSGIYVGAHKKDRRVHLVWVNYHRPGERAQIVLTDEIKASGEKKYMGIAEWNLHRAEKDLRLAFYNNFKCFDHKNLELLEFKGDGISMLDMDLVDNTPRFLQVVVSDEVRKTFMKHVNISEEDTREKTLISAIDALKLL